MCIYAHAHIVTCTYSDKTYIHVFVERESVCVDTYADNIYKCLCMCACVRILVAITQIWIRTQHDTAMRNMIAHNNTIENPLWNRIFLYGVN